MQIARRQREDRQVQSGSLEYDKLRRELWSEQIIVVSLERENVSKLILNKPKDHC